MECILLDTDKKTGRVKVHFKDTNPHFINALRRTIMERVPTMAIEDIEFRQNSSILYDEIVAHRLGLIPLKTDLKSYNLKETCKCDGEGCARCTLQLTLSSKGPATVYAKDLQSQDPKVIPVYPDTPIVKLHKGQEIELIATAMLGKGQEHTKWSPGLVWHMYEPTITVNNNAKQFDQFKHMYPPQVFDKAGKIDKKLMVTPNVIDACDGVCDDIVKVEYSDKDFIVMIEPWGQLSPKEMVIQALDSLQEQTDAFEKALQDAK